MKRVYVVVAMLAHAGIANAADADWPRYGGDDAKTRHSALTQINRGNVGQLALAWQYDTGEKGDTQTQPIVVGRTLYGYTPSHKTFALDAATGQQLWSFDSGIAGVGANRGLMYWKDGEDARVFAAVDNFVYALDAAHGQTRRPRSARRAASTCAKTSGRDAASQSVRLTTPGVIYRDLMILGGRVSESLPASPGHVRAYDVRTGALRWTFRTIPQPGEPGYDTWPKDAWQYIGGANSWPGMTLDEKRGLVFVPTGSAAADFYGGNRLGDNLYANCLLALDASNRQAALAFPVRETRRARSRPAVGADARDAARSRASRSMRWCRPPSRVSSSCSIATRASPCFRSRKCPRRPRTCRARSPARPICGRRLPAPYARQRLTADDLTTRTPEANRWAREQFATTAQRRAVQAARRRRRHDYLPRLRRRRRMGRPGVRRRERPALRERQRNGVARLAGAQRHRPQYRQVHLPARLRRLPRRQRTGLAAAVSLAGRHRQPHDARTVRRARAQGRRTHAGVPAPAERGVGGHPRVSHRRPRCPGRRARHTRPSTWRIDSPVTGAGSIRRVIRPSACPGARSTPSSSPRANTCGAFLSANSPSSRRAACSDTGSENYGGPLVTSGGLLFIGATIHDRKFRAFDKANGKLLWETALPCSADATPITYQVDGRQYVAIFASGGKERGGSGGGVYLSFALPARQ